MFTLQILDRGQTFLHSLDERPLLIGSGAAAGLRLGEAEVLDVHARIEFAGQKARLVAMAKVLVNGRAVMTKDLELGDRIEIGRAVLVFGKTVARAASAEDVLEDVRGRPVRTRPRHGVRAVAIGAALVLLGCVVMFATMPGNDEAVVRGELALVARARQAGDLVRASAALAKLRREWALAEDDRLQRVEAEQAQIDAISACAAQLTAEVLAADDVRTYAQWLDELKRLESEGEPAQRIASRMVRSSLRETYARRPKKPRPAAPENAPDADVAAPAAGPAAVAEAPPGPAPVAAAPRATGARVIADADRLVEQGLYAQALAVLQSELGHIDEADVVTVLRERIASVRAAAQRAMAEVVREAQARCSAGEHRQAVTALILAQHRFPGGEEFAALAQTLAEAEATVAAAEAKRLRAEVRPSAPPAEDAATRAATLASLRTHLDAIREAEERADFALALQLLREGAGLVRERDADFAARLEDRAAEAELLQAFHLCVAAAVGAGRHFEVALRSGRVLTLTSVNGADLVGRTADGEVVLHWNDVAPAGVQGIAEQVQPQGQAVLGAAALLYKAEAAPLAEQLLGKALRADAALKDLVDRAVARGRGERFDGRGYVLGKDGFVAVRSIEAGKEAQKIAARLDTLLRGKDRAARDAFLTEALAQGPDALEALIGAFRKEFGSQLKKLDAGALKKQIDRLQAQRDQLDAARKFAKDLIYDEVKYFYPYKPPAVSGERFAEYNRVQAEVDRRVAAVNEIWHDDRLHIKVPASLQNELDRLDWAAGVLADLGELDADSLQAVAWARALPAGDTIGIADYCRTPAERTQLEEWRRIEAWNRAVEQKVSSAVREQVRITNEYRAMFRHRPLAIVLAVCSAAQGHAEEMSRLGYFDHMSPTPGRRTPYDRMRLAGYGFGVSENIALNDSAMGAHIAWCHSSDHHRNLLSPTHKEIGVGADGRNWVQNFGSGTTWQQDPAWQSLPNGRAGKR